MEGGVINVEDFCSWFMDGLVTWGHTLGAFYWVRMASNWRLSCQVTYFSAFWWQPRKILPKSGWIFKHFILILCQENKQTATCIPYHLSHVCFPQIWNKKLQTRYWSVISYGFVNLTFQSKNIMSGFLCCLLLAAELSNISLIWLMILQFRSWQKRWRKCSLNSNWNWKVSMLSWHWLR